MTTKLNPTDVSVLIVELQDANDRYEACRAAEADARSKATAALNALNALQRRFDAMIDALLRESPTSSDWRKGVPQRNEA